MTMVEVTTGARLHFGLLCGAPDSNWHYGGIGMMIEAPAWQLRLQDTGPDSTDIINASTAAQQRLTSLITDFRKTLPSATSVRCTAIREMSFHSGLGAGTQLTLAIANGLRLLNNQPRPKCMAEFATALGRGRRSDIGTYGFETGGFIVDHGKTKDSKRLAPQRIRFPEEWRMLLITPQQAAGLSGHQEESFFGEQRYLNEAVLKRISDAITSRIVPSLQQMHYAEFSESLANYGCLVGEYYASEQGGIYSNPIIRDVAAWLKLHRYSAPVQSSWGPTACVPMVSVEAAEALAKRIAAQPKSDQLTVSITRGNNIGATLKTLSPEGHRSLG